MSVDLRGQHIDITGVRSGTYWLDSIVNPTSRLVLYGAGRHAHASASPSTKTATVCGCFPEPRRRDGARLTVDAGDLRFQTWHAQAASLMGAFSNTPDVLVVAPPARMYWTNRAVAP
jgi:hypothetical protein